MGVDRGTTNAKRVARAVGYALLVLALLAWTLFAVFVLHPWYIREIGTW